LFIKNDNNNKTKDKQQQKRKTLKNCKKL